jgi:methylated-DNA-[protein]-cysteine S-methyltransferase
MRPTLVQYDAPGWGVGEVWLDAGRVFHTELPRPRPRRTVGGRAPRTPWSDTGQTRLVEIVRRLQAFFEGEAVDFNDVDMVVGDGFYGDCTRALRAVPRGEVVTYGELAALAGYPGAARAAGTFCGRCALSPFVPTHRVVGATGIGSYGELGVEYKRRLLALEHLEL